MKNVLAFPYKIKYKYSYRLREESINFSVEIPSREFISLSLRKSEILYPKLVRINYLI